MMNVLIDTESGSSFSITVDFWETVLSIKEKIEKSQGIPASKQTLYFQGKVLQDHLPKFDCQLLLDSRLLLYISPEDNPNQNNDQMLIDSATGKKITKVVARRIHNEYSSGPAYSLVELLVPQDSTMKVTVGNQVVQTTEQSPPSDSAKEKLTVYVKPYEDDPRIVQVEVNADDNVEELRKELVKMQERGELYLPHEGFYLVYSALPLTESESFKWNLVFFEIQSGSSFDIEVYYKDTVLEMKEKIEKFQRISVSKQSLIFDGTVLRDDLDIEQFKIVHGSRLQLFVSPDHNPNQTEQSPPPSNSTEQIIDGHQESTLTDQTEQSPSSNSVKEMITNIKDSSEKERIPKKRIVVYVLPYSGESEAVKEVPVAVNVKMNDNVKELRNELVKIEENGELNLPQEGYFLIHKNRVLNENQSFWVVGVDHNDTIEILPTHLTRGSFNLDS
ncbi:unnamed protein product [Arabidopsis arenosa]|uniref:Ubiquitin-like domain-containing protein n=1 Tax=Arabidopsis arenosa TaxID=38785 RepID=A0A8S2AW75_ARAAE|nr:unnamed protein product [Arabidopsis arenosa]